MLVSRSLLHDVGPSVVRGLLPLLFLWIVASVVVLPMTVVTAARGTVECNCFHGTVVTSAPCECDCGGDPLYLGPYCAFKATDTPEIVMAHLNASGTWSASYLAENLRLHYELAEDSTLITFRFVETAQSNPFSRVYESTHLVTRWFIAGNISSLFLASAKDDETWLQALDIVDANVINLDIQSLSRTGRLGQALFSVSNNDVFLWTVVWIGAFLLIVLFLSIECCCCSTNTEKRLRQLQATAAASDAQQYNGNNRSPYSGVNGDFSPVVVASMEATDSKGSTDSSGAVELAARPCEDHGSPTAVVTTGSPPKKDHVQQPSRSRGYTKQHPTAWGSPAANPVSASKEPSDASPNRRSPQRKQKVASDWEQEDPTLEHQAEGKDVDDEWVFDEQSGYFWSDEQQMFWDEASGLMFDPAKDQWYDPETDEWIAPLD